MDAKYRMLIQYRGTGYAGWQVQPHHATIQGELQAAISTVCGERAAVVGSGRTDAGVHARGQVAHFRLSARREPGGLRNSLNAVLPTDIRIMRLGFAEPDFHAQKSAQGKRYEYRLYKGPVLSPFLSDYVVHTRKGLELAAMQLASRVLTGRHDFSGFTSSRSSASSRVRTLSCSEIRTKGHFVTYRAEGDGFLHHQIRNIVGTLLQIGTGKRSVSEMEEILRSCDRTRAGPTAPARGLCLVRVWYGPGGRGKCVGSVID